MEREKEALRAKKAKLREIQDEDMKKKTDILRAREAMMSSDDFKE
jgi:hypothetical protein